MWYFRLVHLLVLELAAVFEQLRRMNSLLKDYCFKGLERILFFLDTVRQKDYLEGMVLIVSDLA